MAHRLLSSKASGRSRSAAASAERASRQRRRERRSVVAAAAAHSRLLQIELHELTSAAGHVPPRSSRAHHTSPPGCWSVSTHSTAPSTTGQASRRKSPSPEARKWCQTPVAAYAQKLASVNGSSIRPSRYPAAQEPSERWWRASQR